MDPGSTVELLRWASLFSLVVSVVALMFCSAERRTPWLLSFGYGAFGSLVAWALR